MRETSGVVAKLTTGLSIAILAVAASAQADSTLVSVGDHRLEVLAKGEGKPTVVFEAGFSGGLVLWRAVQNRVAAVTRTIAYERAGLGRSELGPEPRTATQIALELHELLKRQGVREPVILVGHSAGGMYARVFAHAYPSKVSALVLVDPATEGYYERMKRETPQEWKSAPVRMSDGMRQQWAALPTAMNEAAAAWPLPQVPVVLFTATKPLTNGLLASESDLAAWLREHDALESRIDRAERVTIQDANHLSILTVPQVGDRILKLVDEVRAKSR